jgi:Kef-type K+ transport system membrane component KefB
MNILLSIGLLLIIGYIFGWLLDKIGIPKIIGYIATGIIFSPNTIDFLDKLVIQTTHPIMEVCLAFIVFEVGGALKWSKIKAHEKEIISITFLASIFPLIFVSGGIFLTSFIFPEILPFDTTHILLIALPLGALASPTEPAATLAVMHENKARGKVTNTILGVAALDDVVGIILYSITISAILIFTVEPSGFFGNPIVNTIYEMSTAIIIGTIIGLIIDPIARFLHIKNDGQWVVIIFSFIIFCVGLSEFIHVDALLSTLTMGVVIVNKSTHQHSIFRIVERYTEELIFLFFFLLSGLNLDISSIPQSFILILLFVILRALGKYMGTYTGAKLVHANQSIQKYTAGGLLPQGGIVIGLVLSIYETEPFSDISEIVLTTILGAVVIHELIGPIIAKYSLKKAGEIKLNNSNSYDNN